ncbi:DinB family protein [Puia sp. P3]|uniref:DinB family protein n=1 Tax=Puia sp. P3 TaxID=3423952 RepID=UPI003D666384
MVQPIVDVSPPKWHLGHTTWFWEAFVLIPNLPDYKPCNPDYNYVFNSYYETIGARVVRTDRGNLSRPSVDEIYDYRKYVDDAMEKFIAGRPGKELEDLIILGLNHEQQHQELLFSDIKYILGHNPLFPAWSDHDIDEDAAATIAPNPVRPLPPHRLPYAAIRGCTRRDLLHRRDPTLSPHPVRSLRDRLCGE